MLFIRILKALKRVVFKVATPVDEFFRFFPFKSRLVPVKYFSGKVNVGDQLNVYLFKKISNRSIFQIKSGVFSHALGIGSIMHLGSPKSVVWGSGIIEPKLRPSDKAMRKMDFRAVRGKLTREIVEKARNKPLDCPLGDPAVLMPFFYSPEFKKKYSIGIVPHYVDQDLPLISDWRSQSGVKVIDVRLPVERFIDEICSCEVIASSSLHGLIFSDTYKIPNVWLQLSDKVIGGKFKFKDYYSTTYISDRDPVVINGKSEEYSSAFDLIPKALVAEFKGDKELLLKSFPHDI